MHKALTDIFGERALIQRCRENKKRNVADALPERMRSSVRSAMSQAYATRDPPKMSAEGSIRKGHGARGRGLEVCDRRGE